jgi:hypothetical protein
MTRCCHVHCPKHGTCGRRGAAGHCKDGCHAHMSKAEQRRLEKAFFAPKEPTFAVFLNMSCGLCGTTRMHTAVWHDSYVHEEYCETCYCATDNLRRKEGLERITDRDPYGVKDDFVQMTAAQFAAHQPRMSR